MNKPDPDELEFLGDYEPTPEPLLRDWTTRLLSGETGPQADRFARRIIQDFCHCVWMGHTPERSTMEWLAEVLSDILENGRPDARRALSLEPKRPGGKDQTWKHIRIAQWVFITIERGYEEPDAIKKAAAVFFQDEKTIRRAWKKCNKGKGWNFSDDDVTAESFKQIQRPLPEKTQWTTKK